jgi:hypothetical protein
MPVTRAATRSHRQPFSCHTSNPFDDLDVARRALGYGSSPLSECSSDLGGYGDPEPTVYLPRTSEEELEPVEGRGAVVEPEAVGDDEGNIGADPNIGVDENIGADAYYDDDLDDDEDAFWDEDEFEEEHSIYFKTTEERCEIQEEIQDLQRAVPRLQEDYEILDRLGTGA